MTGNAEKKEPKFEKYPHKTVYKKQNKSYEHAIYLEI